MRIRLQVMALGFTVLCLAAATIYGQEKSNTNDTSLGDIARQVRAQKAKESKPVRVVTSDTISRPDADAAGMSGSSKGKSTTDSTPIKSEAESPNHDEAYYRSQMSTLQGKLDTDKRQLEVLQQKLGQNQMQYYPDPNKTLKQEYTRGDIDKLTAEIDAKKQHVADDEKAIDDLRDQLRHEGGDPGWLR